MLPYFVIRTKKMVARIRSEADRCILLGAAAYRYLDDIYQIGVLRCISIYIYIFKETDVLCFLSVR